MSLRVFSMNFWALPFGLSRHVPHRLAALSARLPELDVDVVAFQEIWTQEAREHLLAAGAASGFDHRFALRGRANSGLLVMSRLPVLRNTVTPYHVRGRPERVQHADFYGGKGFFEVEVETDHGPVTLMNTHLHAAYDDGGRRDDYVGERVAQAAQFALAARTHSTPVLAVGDFNMREGSPEYEVLTGLGGLDDVAAGLDRRQATSLATHPYTGADARDQRIDYAFLRSGREQSAAAVSIERVFDEELVLAGQAGGYSDHAGLLIEIDLPEAADVEVADRPPSARSLDIAESELLAAIERTRERADFQSRAGISGFGASLLGLIGAERVTRNRRNILRGLAMGLPLIGLAGSGLLGFLGHTVNRDEVERFELVYSEVNRLRGLSN